MTFPRPAPDWYPDPVDARVARWWDGTMWTGHTQWVGAYSGTGRPEHSPNWTSFWAPPPPPPTARTGPPLDAALADLRTRSPQPWGWRPVAVPLATLVGLIVAGLIVTATIEPTGHVARTVFAVVANFALEGLLALSVWLAGRRVAQANGGWAATFGLRRPCWSDLAWAAAGIGITLVSRGVVVAVANALSHGRAAREAENLQVHTVTPATVVLLVVVVGMAAPVIEELMFRGLFLRTFMRRWSFWPSAALSTLIFAGLHTYEVGTLVGALTLAAAVGTLGITNCWLNRRTNSLIPGMVVHASFNLLAVTVLIAQAH